MTDSKACLKLGIDPPCQRTGTELNGERDRRITEEVEQLSYPRNPQYVAHYTDGWRFSESYCGHPIGLHVTAAPLKRHRVTLEDSSPQNWDAGDPCLKREPSSDQHKVYLLDTPFTKFPFHDGCGVENCTALPMEALCARLSIKSTGLALWIEAPPLSGKTSLGHILRWKYDFVLVTVILGSVTFTKEVISAIGKCQRLFVDEAQRLGVRDIQWLRKKAQAEDMVVVCAGVSGEPIQPCAEDDCRTKTEADHTTSCYHCTQRKCHAGLGCMQSSHMWVDTSSSLITTSRVYVQDLVVDKTEVVSYLKHIKCDTCRTPTEAQATEVADALIEYTGGRVGYVMGIITLMCTDSARPFMKDFSPAEFVRRMRHGSIFEKFSGRLPTCTEIEIAAVVTWMRDGVQPDQATGERLRQKGVLVKGTDGKWQSSSPFVFELLYLNLFRRRAHPTPPKRFEYTNVDQAVLYILHHMKKEHLIGPDNTTLPEDQVNGHIMWILKASLPRGGTHVGPAKRIAKGGTYAQVDHQVCCGELGDGILVEICWGDVAARCTRFTKKGPYTQGYPYRGAAVVSFAHMEEPQAQAVTSFVLDDARCHFYKVYVTAAGFRLARPMDRMNPALGCVLDADVIPYSNA